MPNFQIPQLRPNQVAIVIGVLGALLLVVVAYFFFRNPAAETGAPVSLTVWGTEPAAAMRDALAGYVALRPNVTPIYEELAPEEYEAKLIDALAAGEGPDVFTVPSTDIGKYEDKIVPAPTSLPAASLDSLFPKAVPASVVDGANVLALPLSLDTLVLVYNRDLLDAAGIVAPPTTWDEVIADIPLLAAIDDQGQVQRSAIALGGTTRSVRDVADIVSLLMIQNGAVLSNQAHTSVAVGPQGEAALRFYTQFANPISSAYTWNDALGDSFQQFADGKLAMLVTYASAVQTLKKNNAFIDARTAPVPQATGGTPRSYGTYPTLAVSKQSKNPTWGWDLVRVLTTDKALMAAYSKATNRSSALTSVIGDQIKDPSTTVAATQALQARSWFAWDGAGAASAIDIAVDDMVSGVSDANRAAATLEQRLRALIRQ